MKEVGMLAKGREIRPGDFYGNNRVVEVMGDSMGVVLTLKNPWGPNETVRIPDYKEWVTITRMVAA